MKHVVALLSVALLAGAGQAAAEEFTTLNGKRYPRSEFKFNPGEAGFPQPHYHAANGVTATAVDGSLCPDPAPLSEGFGLLKFTPGDSQGQAALTSFGGLRDSAGQAPLTTGAFGEVFEAALSPVGTDLFARLLTSVLLARAEELAARDPARARGRLKAARERANEARKGAADAQEIADEAGRIADEYEESAQEARKAAEDAWDKARRTERLLEEDSDFSRRYRDDIERQLDQERQQAENAQQRADKIQGDAQEAREHAEEARQDAIEAQQDAADAQKDVERARRDVSEAEWNEVLDSVDAQNATVPISMICSGACLQPILTDLLTGQRRIQGMLVSGRLSLDEARERWCRHVSRVSETRYQSYEEGYRAIYHEPAPPTSVAVDYLIGQHALSIGPPGSGARRQPHSSGRIGW